MKTILTDNYSKHYLKFPTSNLKRNRAYAIEFGFNRAWLFKLTYNLKRKDDYSVLPCVGGNNEHYYFG